MQASSLERLARVVRPAIPPTRMFG